MQRSGGGIPPLLLVLIALVGFGGLLWLNARPTPELRVILPTQGEPTEAVNVWELILQEGFGSDSTPLPTVTIPTGEFLPPTVPAVEGNTTPIAAQDVAAGQGAAEVFSVGATPTRPLPTVAPIETDIPLTTVFVEQPREAWQLPPLLPPLSRDPFGRDHYYFIRPVDSNATNRGLFYYPFGSDGPDNDLRIHSGIDMPNSIGQTVRAGADGTVTWAGPSFQSTSSYGIVVMIEHDFGYNGQPLYSLYAHLSAVLVGTGQRVTAGDAIGLVGNTGRVSGPHVHFEVRLGENRYASTYNPVLWMVPYVGTGVIAGRVTNINGDLVEDAPVTIRSYATGLTVDTTTTYIYTESGVDVNADPMWRENFVVGDVPVGRHTVIANIGGESVSALVTVVEGTTNFVELSPRRSETPQSGS